MSALETVFDEDWFGEPSCLALADLYKKVAHLDGDVVEVGSWEGRSTIALANAAYPAKVQAVDTWKGSPGEISEELARERDVFSTFSHNIASATKGNVEVHRMDWRDYFAADAEPIRLLFIDATHTYEEVRDNIAAALPRLVPGGIICGDDAAHPPPVTRAVVNAFPDALAIATLWWWQKPGDLTADYERLCLIQSDINEHLPRFVELVTSRNAQHVIELGTRSGVSTIAWLYGLSQTGGRLTSVDIAPKPEIGDWQHWDFIQSDDLDPELLGRLDDADIVFIDTSHHHRQTVAELNVYWHLVKPGGLIVLHDTELNRPERAPRGDPAYPVKRAVEEFCEAEGLHFTIDPRCWGRAEIHIP